VLACTCALFHTVRIYAPSRSTLLHAQCTCQAHVISHLYHTLCSHVSHFVLLLDFYSFSSWISYLWTHHVLSCMSPTSSWMTCTHSLFCQHLIQCYTIFVEWTHIPYYPSLWLLHSVHANL
jgi:hypothetical protein